MTTFAKVYVEEDVDVLVATLLLAQGLDATTVRDREMLYQFSVKLRLIIAPPCCGRGGVWGGVNSAHLHRELVLGKLDDEQLSQTFAIAFTQQFRSVSQKF